MIWLLGWGSFYWSEKVTAQKVVNQSKGWFINSLKS